MEQELQGHIDSTTAEIEKMTPNMKAVDRSVVGRDDLVLLPHLTLINLTSYPHNLYPSFLQSRRYRKQVGRDGS